MGLGNHQMVLNVSHVGKIVFVKFLGSVILASEIMIKIMRILVTLAKMDTLKTRTVIVLIAQMVMQGQAIVYSARLVYRIAYAKKVTHVIAVWLMQSK